MRHVNFMSPSSVRREYQHTRIRQWVSILLATTMLLAAVTALFYPACRRVAEQRIAMDLDYDLTRQLLTANKSLRKNIHSIRETESFFLGLSQETPYATLLGVVGKSAAESKGKIFLEDLRLRDDRKSQTGLEDQPIQLSLAGNSLDSESILAFTESLKSQLPFANITLNSTDEVVLNHQAMLAFSIDCQL